MSLQNDEYDPFAGSTGLKEGPGVIVESWFATDPQYNQGKTLSLYLKKQFDDGEEIVDRYSCGPDWASYDDGETAEHPKDTAQRPQGFNVNSQIMELVNAAFATGNVVDHAKPNAMFPEGRPITDVERMFRDVSSNQYENRGPRDARIWLGFKFQWGIKTETKKFKDRDTQEMIERVVTKSLPVTFLGKGEVSVTPGNEFQAPTANVGGIAPPPPPPPATPAASVDNPGIPPAPAPTPPPPVPTPPPIPQPEAVAQPQPVQETVPTPQPAPTPQPQQTAPAPPTPPPTPTQNGDLSSLVNAETAAQMKVLAQAQPYHEWVDSVMAIPGIVSIPQLVTQLADDALYNSLRAG